MEVSSQTDESINILETQIRQCFGSIVWTHKTHEKQADLYLKNFNKFKITQIILSAVTTSGLIISILGDNKIGTIISTVLSAILLCINLIFLNYDLSKMAQKHIDTANKLWEVREEYISLLTDIKAGFLDEDTIRIKRDELNRKVAEIYNNAPRTTSKAYKLASEALKKNEEFTFSDDEIDRFLPKELWRKLTP
ncbi:SLATT domain-containing protein [Caldicellulosiruptor sp. DIB 104C]|uniref:SLATT domain-containing protein n=1 Tax=Caldicellulosiruptor sp. DIB 104C TaxID=3019889 RepID=UPI0023061CB5|nr:SLATT domain-containing protein [Caldicellulosiruptor sp. DIB 104C]